MNKFINLLLLFIGFPTMFLAIIVGFDIPLTFINTYGGEMPYRFEIFLGLGLLLLIINLRRSIRRWMGIFLVNKSEKFVWSATMSKARIQRANVYSFLEGLIMFIFGYGLFTVTNDAWMPFVGLAFGTVDNIVFSVYGTVKNKFKVGLTSKALMVADRDVILIYFNGLRSVSRQQQSIYFDFIKDLQLSFPVDCIKEEDQAIFFKELKANFNPDKVYFSNKMEG